MNDKDYLLKLYKFKNAILNNLLSVEHHYHKKLNGKSQDSYAAGIYNAYKHILDEVNNLISEVETQANGQQALHIFIILRR